MKDRSPSRKMCAITFIIIQNNIKSRKRDDSISNTRSMHR